MKESREGNIQWYFSYEATRRNPMAGRTGNARASQQAYAVFPCSLLWSMSGSPKDSMLLVITTNSDTTHNRSVDTATRLWAGRPWNRSLVLWKGEIRLMLLLCTAAQRRQGGQTRGAVVGREHPSWCSLGRSMLLSLSNLVPGVAAASPSTNL
jgi:hypothetical protein